MDRSSQASALHRAVDAVLGHGERVPSLPVAPRVDPAALRQRLAAFDLENGGSADTVTAAVAELLESATVHTTSPRYFGLFNPTPLAAGIVADILTAGFNPQLAVWSHAPAAVEVEALLIERLGAWLGIDAARGSFTTGGAEANATAVLLALASRFPTVRDTGVRGLPGRPCFYASQESHLAWMKIAQQCGLGRDSVRLVGVDEALRLDAEELAERIAADRAAGDLPFLVVATAGTTSAGVIDPLHAVADVARTGDLWLHVDAAWAGAAALSDTLRPHLDGIERADSVTVDAHKWLSVPMGAGTFITRHGDLLPTVFDVSTGYMPPAVAGVAPDPYTTSMQWSRRATGLKLLLTLAVHGRAAYAEQFEHDRRLADQLRDGLVADGWELANATPLPVVCVTEPGHRDDLTFHAGVADAVVASGDAWISSVTLAGRPAVRACVISHRTTPHDVDALVAALHQARERIRTTSVDA